MCKTRDLSETGRQRWPREGVWNNGRESKEESHADEDRRQEQDAREEGEKEVTAAGGSVGRESAPRHHSASDQSHAATLGSGHGRADGGNGRARSLWA